MTTDDILDGILTREAGWRDAQTRPDGTVDPPTNRGITLPTLQQTGHLLGLQPPILLDDLKQLDAGGARTIYVAVYMDAPGFTIGNVPFEPLRVQLIDFGINSGPERAIRWLQRVLRIPVTGVMDVALVNCLKSYTQVHTLAIVNDALVAARSYMIDQLVDHGQLRKQDEEGVESRALSFFLAVP